MSDKQETTLIKYPTDHGEVKLSPGIIRRYLVSGKPELVTDAEIIMFMQLCRYQGLNPFLREAYLIKYSASDPATIVTGKDTFTKRAANIKECEGYNAGIIVKTGNGIERRKGAAVFEDEELIGGWAEIFRAGWREALHVEVSIKEYIRKNREGEPNRPWGSMPATMIRKVSLVQGLREAFPDRYQGMYSPEEMPIDDSKLDSKPVTPVEESAEEIDAEIRKSLLKRLGTLSPYISDDEKNLIRKEALNMPTPKLTEYVTGWEKTVLERRAQTDADANQGFNLIGPQGNQS